MEGYQKVTDSWANDLDKLNQNLNNTKLAFIEAINLGINPFVKVLNAGIPYMTEMRKESTGFKVTTDMMTTAVSGFAMLSLMNLGKVKGAVSSLGSSMAGLFTNFGKGATGGSAMLGRMGVYGLIATVAMEGALSYFTKQAEESEALAEKAMNEAKAWDDLNKKTKETKQRFNDLKNSMRGMEVDKFTGKVKDLSKAFADSIPEMAEFKELNKALSDNKVLLSLGFDEVAFDKEADRIINRTKFFNQTVNDISKGKEVKNNNPILIAAQNENLASRIVGSETFKSDEHRLDVNQILDKNAKEAKKQFDIINKSASIIYSKEQEKIRTAGYANPEYQDYLNADTTNKAKMIKDKGWDGAKLADMKKKYEDYMRLSPSFVSEQDKQFDLVKKAGDELEKLGISKVGIAKTIRDNMLAIGKNESDRLEQRLTKINSITDSLELAGKALEEIRASQQEAFMKKSTFNSMSEFKAGLDKIGLSNYKTLIKDFSGVINSFASQSAKMDFMANGFMDLAKAVSNFNEEINKLDEQDKMYGSNRVVNRQGVELQYTEGANIGKYKTIAEAYKNFNNKNMWGKEGFIGKKAQEYITTNYNEETKSDLWNLHKSNSLKKGYKESIKEAEKIASIQKTSMEYIEGYNNGLDIETKKLEKVNASKYKGYEIDKQIAELQHKNYQESQKTEIKTRKSYIESQFPDYIKDGELTLSRKGFENILNPKTNILEGNNTVDLNNYDSVGSMLDKLENKKNIMNTSEKMFVDYLKNYYVAMSDAQKNEIDYKEAIMNYDKNIYDYQEEIFNSYMEYLGSSQTEIAILEQKKVLLSEQSKIQAGTVEQIATNIEMYKLDNEISNKKIEHEQKLADIALQRLKYENELASYSADDLKYLENKYTAEQKILTSERDKVSEKVANYKNDLASSNKKEEIDKMLEKSYNKYKDINVGYEGKTLTSEQKIDKDNAEQKMLEIQAKRNALAKIDLTTPEGREQFLKDSVEYQGLLLDLDEKENKIKESTLGYDKERLKIQAELNDLIGQRQLGMIESEYQKSRDLHKEVFGTNNYNDNATQRQKETLKASQDRVNAEKELGRVKLEVLSKISDAEYESLVNNGNVNEFLKNNVDYKKAEVDLLEKSNAELTVTNEHEKQRLEYLKSQAETLLGMIDSLSKGEAIKFDASSAIKGSAGAFVKLGQNVSQGYTNMFGSAEDRYKKSNTEKMTVKDWASVANAGIGVATNIYGQIVQSQLNVVDAELKNLEIKKQLAKTDKERQQIDEEILNKQKQQIDLQYKQSTQTMGVTGTAGSALGGALSGAAMGTAIMPGIGTAIGAGMGLLGGILSGNSAKKQAEQQKQQLEAQYRANEYLASLQKLQELNNNLIESVYANTEKGIAQAMKDAIKEAYKTQNEKGTFNYNPKLNTANLNLTGNKWEKAYNILYGESYIETFNKIKDANITVGPDFNSAEDYKYFMSSAYWGGSNSIFKEQFNENIADVQNLLKNLNFSTSLEDIDALKQKIVDLQTVLTLGGADGGELDLLLEDWNSYVDGIALVSKAKNLYYQEYFGFKVDLDKDKDTGFITGIQQGEWEKRTDFLNTFVENAITGTEKISKSISTLVIEGFSNAFIRNNTKLNTMLDNFEKDVTNMSDSIFNNETLTNTKGFSPEIVSNVKTMVNDSLALNNYQNKLNVKVQEFASLWVKSGGSISDVIDMLPEYTKTLQSAMEKSLSVTDYQDRFNSIGSALTSTIESKLSEVSFANLQNKFLASNDILSTIMNGGSVDMNSMIELSQSLKSYSAQAEQTAYKTKAMLEMLSMESNVDYGIDNTQIEYQIGTTSTNVYNFNNSINTTIGNFLADNKAVQQFTDTIVGNMFESFKKQGFKIEK